MYLVGDIGGTNTRLAWGEVQGPQVKLSDIRNYSSTSYASLEEVLEVFLAEVRHPISGASFGVAGPIRDNRATLTNLSWRLDGASLTSFLKVPRVRLLNDLEAQAYGIPALTEEEVLVLNPGIPDEGHHVLIAAGTGLGEALLIHTGRGHQVIPTEGGHTDFAPRDELEVGLLSYLQQTLFGGVPGHVSYERVVSGPGLLAIWRYLGHLGVEGDGATTREVEQRGGSAISEAAVAESCLRCLQAAELFLSIYGAEAGNLALKTLPRGGVFVGGGIISSLLPVARQGAFMAGFTGKGRFASLMESLPVKVILNTQVGLVGATRVAAGEG